MKYFKLYLLEIKSFRTRTCRLKKQNKKNKKEKMTKRGVQKETRDRYWA